MVNKVSAKLAEVKLSNANHTLVFPKAVTLAEGLIFSHVDRTPDTREKVEVETLSDTVAKLEAKKQLKTLGHRLGEMQVDKRH